MNLRNTVLIGLSLLLGACQPKSGHREKEGMKIDLDRDDKVSVFDFFSKIELIPLETNEQSVMSYPLRKIALHKGNFYVLDKQGESIQVFAAEGRFVEKIDKKGRGPGEYDLLYDFDFNRFTGNLELMSPDGYVNIYDPDGNKFLDQIVLPDEILAVHHFTVLSPDVYIFFSDSREGNKMLFYSVSQNKIVSETYGDLPTYLFFKTLLHHSWSPFYIHNDSVRFVQVYDGTIYDVTPDYQLSPRYSWDFGEQNLFSDIFPREGLTTEEYFEFNKMVNTRYAAGFWLYEENSNYFITRFKYRNRLKYLIFDKHKGTYLLFDNYKENISCPPTLIDDEAMYYYASPQELHMAVRPEVLDDKNKAIFNAVTEFDNPVIVKCTFK
jgi:hypothetical protein